MATGGRQRIRGLRGPPLLRAQATRQHPPTVPPGSALLILFLLSFNSSSSHPSAPPPSTPCASPEDIHFEEPRACRAHGLRRASRCQACAGTQLGVGKRSDARQLLALEQLQRCAATRRHERHLPRGLALGVRVYGIGFMRRRPSTPAGDAAASHCWIRSHHISLQFWFRSEGGMQPHPHSTLNSKL